MTEILDQEAAISALSPDELTLELQWSPAPGPWVLEIGSEQGVQLVELEAGHGFVLGSGKLADVRIADRAVSARHCRLSATSRGLELSDLGARNGVFVGGARVGNAMLDGAGGSFVVGRTTVMVRCRGAADDAGANDSLPGIVGSSAPMRRVAREVRRHARTRAAVLLQGESGTGKDVVARALHELARRPGAYVPLNVGAISESLADAELFGHRRGAFTGAIAARSGAFEQAHRGTLFLDEIADLPMSIQVKLLRVVEDGVVRPIGGSQPISVDTRIVSATWAPLHDRVSQGRFRGDLFHRLSVATIQLPPLRERRSDIPALAHVLLERLRPELGLRRLSSGALARLVAHDFPGNVRELSSVLYRSAVACEGPEIGPEHVQISVSRRREVHAGRLSSAESARLVERHGGNITAAAAAAGVARSTFRSWLAGGRRGPREAAGDAPTS